MAIYFFNSTSRSTPRNQAWAVFTDLIVVRLQTNALKIAHVETLERCKARAIGLPHLTHEHRPHDRRRLQALAILGQQRVGRPHPASDVALTLLKNVSGMTIHDGWPSERWFGCLRTTILSIPGPTTSFSPQIQTFTPLTSTSSG